MDIFILGTESLGVRGLSCVVQTEESYILLDPGIALGYQRYGLLPHPFQIALGRIIRNQIVDCFSSATDIIISHFHGDHVPLADANPYQLSIYSLDRPRHLAHVWCPGADDSSDIMQHRRMAISHFLGMDLAPSEGLTHGQISFSMPMPHGKAGNNLGSVMMARIEADGTVFVHASDIQLLEWSPVEQILEWEPDIVLASGPPVYRNTSNKAFAREAMEKAICLAQNMDTLILDHHLLRSSKGMKWLDDLNERVPGHVACAADFMGRKRCLLEAHRECLYKDLPVPDGWHEDYEKTRKDVSLYTKWRDCDLAKPETWNRKPD